MGTWGTGIRQDDTVLDIQGDLVELLKDGASLEEASQSVIEKYDHLKGDPDEPPLVWIALVDSQWKYGEVDVSLLERVKADYESDAGMQRWLEAGKREYQKRKNAIAKFIEKVSTPNPKPAKRPKRIIRKPKFAAGDCLAIKLPNGMWGAALVTAAVHDRLEYGSNWIVNLSYMSDAKPTVDEFEKRKIMRGCKTYSRFQSDVCINSYGTPGFKAVRESLEVVANIPLRSDDPTSGHTYSHWKSLGRDFIGEYERDRERQSLRGRLSRLWPRN